MSILVGLNVVGVLGGISVLDVTLSEVGATDRGKPAKRCERFQCLLHGASRDPDTVV